jgi:hypothetical protein
MKLQHRLRGFAKRVLGCVPPLRAVARSVRRVPKRYLTGDPIFVYTMAKVGTTTISRNLNHRCEHVHFLSETTLRRNFFQWDAKNPPWRPGRLPLGLVARQRIHSALFQLRRRRVITLIRDPVARNCSLLFEFLVNLMHRHLLEIHSFTNTAELVDDYYRFFVRRDLPVHWFDEEFKPVTGIDVFDHPFDKEEGWGIIRRGNIEVLLLTLEKISLNEKRIQDFVGDSAFRLESRNVGSSKWYSDLYEAFRERFTLTAEESSMLYSSKTMKHFYTEEMIDQFRRKWAKVSRDS